MLATIINACDSSHMLMNGDMPCKRRLNLACAGLGMSASHASGSPAMPQMSHPQMSHHMEQPRQPGMGHPLMAQAGREQAEAAARSLPASHALAHQVRAPLCDSYMCCSATSAVI